MLLFEIKWKENEEEEERTNEESTHHFIYFPHAFDLIRCVFMWFMGQNFEITLERIHTCMHTPTLTHAHTGENAGTLSYHTSSYVLINLSIKSIKFHSHIDTTDTEIPTPPASPTYNKFYGRVCVRALVGVYTSSSTVKYNKLHNSTL